MSTSTSYRGSPLSSVSDPSTAISSIEEYQLDEPLRERNEYVRFSSPKLSLTPISRGGSPLSPISGQPTVISSNEEHPLEIYYLTTGESSQSRKRQAHEAFASQNDHESEPQRQTKRTRISSDRTRELRPTKRVFYNYNKRSSHTSDTPTMKRMRISSDGIRELRPLKRVPYKERSSQQFRLGRVERVPGTSGQNRSSNT